MLAIIIACSHPSLTSLMFARLSALCHSLCCCWSCCLRPTLSSAREIPSSSRTSQCATKCGRQSQTSAQSQIIIKLNTNCHPPIPSPPHTPNHQPCSFCCIPVSQSPRLTRLLTVMDGEMLTSGWLEYFQQCFMSTLDGTEETAFVSQIQTEKFSLLILGNPPLYQQPTPIPLIL